MGCKPRSLGLLSSLVGGPPTPSQGEGAGQEGDQRSLALSLFRAFWTPTIPAPHLSGFKGILWSLKIIRLQSLEEKSLQRGRPAL